MLDLQNYLIKTITENILKKHIMSKLLTIGVAYKPNAKIGIDNNGKAILSPVVFFYFNCDNRTANIVAGSCPVKGLDVKDDALVRAVKVDDYKKFIYGKNAFPKILGALEQVGDYVYDVNNLQNLEMQVEKAIKDVVNSDLSSKLQIDRGAYIDDILKALEQNINDPNFMQYLNSIGAIRRLDPDDYEKIISFSALNNAMILTQWLKSGHQGIPRFLATKVQWQIFNREPIQGAKPIYAVRPSATEKGSKNAAMRKFGIDQQTYDSNAMSRLLVKKGMNDIHYGEANNNSGGFNVDGPYYDLSETQLIQGKQDNYDFDAIVNNKSITNINAAAKKDDDASRFDVLKHADGDASKFDEKTLLSNISNFASNVGDVNLQNLVNSKNLEKCISYLVDQSETIKRLRGKGYTGWNSAIKDAAYKKKIYAELTKALIFMRFGIYPDLAQKIIANNMGVIKKSNGSFNKNMFNAVISDFQNIYFIMAGIAEGITDNLFIWALNALGVSVEEYKSMPNTEEEALGEINGIKESFVKNFNKLLL